MAPTFHDVALSDIALDDHTCIVTYRPQMSALQDSVARAGVLTPLHLRRQPDTTRLQVVCGSKRLLACRHTDRTTVPALVYEVAELPDEQATLLAVYDNLGCRPFNAVEKGRVLKRLRDDFHYAVGTLTGAFCPPLDLPPRADVVQAYCRLTTLDEPLQAAVVEGALPLETALWVGNLAATDRQALLELFTGLRLGSNRAREIITAIDEICQRDGRQPGVLLDDLGVTALLDDPQLAGPQKLERIRRVLHETRYPLFSAHEQRFQDAVRRLRIPSQVRLRPPPYFEGQEYQIAFGFRSRQELQQYAQRLLDAAANEALDDLLSLL
jgi:ParB family chromosome partitioning protein